VEGQLAAYATILIHHCGMHLALHMMRTFMEQLLLVFTGPRPHLVVIGLQDDQELDTDIIDGKGTFAKWNAA